MRLGKWPSWLALVACYCSYGADADEKYNQINQDGSFQFGYDTPDSYHYADGDRNNVVKGEFGGRNPGTGVIDKTVYTAGPRGYRPRGKNIARKYDLNQNGPRPIGSRDDPYYDPYEDPSYNFSFRTRTYQRKEDANRLGDVKGSYSYLDDVGERHNVEFIAGKNTGFHVKTPFPDSNPRAYGPLFFNGRGKPIPRGRTSIQRGLDGSYKFISTGPDQRRTETSDSTGHVRGSYTYLDDKGVQHSVHYIAGPETGYRVLKNVKGPHLPNIYPFSGPDYYDPFDKTAGDVFIPEETGRPRPAAGNRGGGGGTTAADEDGDRTGADGDYDNVGDGRPDYEDGGQGNRGPGGSSTVAPFGSRPRPTSTRPGTSRPGTGSTTSRPRPSGGGNRPYTPSYPDDGDDGEGIDDLDLFGGSNLGSSTSRPPQAPSSPGDYGPSSGGYDESEGQRPSSSRPPFSDGSSGEDDFGIFGSETGDKRRPTYGTGSQSTTSRPSSISTTSDIYGAPSEGSLEDTSGARGQNGGTYSPSGEGGLEEGRQPTPGSSVYGTPTTPSRRRPGGRKPGQRRPPGASRAPSGEEESPAGIGVSSGSGFSPDLGTIVRNLGDRVFSVPPGASVRAHVQAIDLIPLDSRIPSPSEQFKAETTVAQQLNEGTDVVINTTEMNLKQSTVF